MGRFVVGAGLVTMMSAVAFLMLVADDASVPVSVVNGAAVVAFWGFVAGTLIAICGGLQRAR